MPISAEMIWLLSFRDRTSQKDVGIPMSLNTVLLLVNCCNDKSSIPISFMSKAIPNPTRSTLPKRAILIDLRPEPFFRRRYRFYSKHFSSIFTMVCAAIFNSFMRHGYIMPYRALEVNP